jgi:diphosphomevalonate decarboxylase
LPVCYTIDAGPNVHVICLGSAAREVVKRLKKIPGVGKVLVARPGGPAKLVS